MWLTEEQFGNYLGPPFMHLCHGLGLQGSEPPFVRYDSEQELVPGMVLSCEAYLRDNDMTYGVRGGHRDHRGRL